MGYDARTVAFAALSFAQRLALIDLVASRNGLTRIATVTFEGESSHRHATLIALEKRGLCRIKSPPYGFGAARRTDAGRKMIINEFGDAPALVDCDQLGRRKRREEQPR